MHRTAATSSAEKIPASVFIICCNEAANMRRVLDSVRAFDDIVVVDSGSTDSTLSIAAEYGCRIFHHDWQGHARQKQFAMQQCRHDWVLNLDADERLTPALCDELVRFMRAHEQDEVVALAIPFREYFLGQAIAAHSHHIARPRFFRRSHARYPETAVHEGAVFAGKTAKVRGVIEHFGESSIAIKVSKNNQYSQLRAEEKAAKGKRPSLAKLLLVFPLMFFKSYILRRSFLNGWRGFVNSMINAFYAFLKEAKLFEASARRDMQEAASVQDNDAIAVTASTRHS